jgi:hypothetical protein
MNWLAGLAIILLLIVAQEWFLEAHRRRYGMWRSTRERRLWADPEERSRMWTAFTHRDQDPKVERVRLVALAVIISSLVAGLALFLRPPGR